MYGWAGADLSSVAYTWRNHRLSSLRRPKHGASSWHSEGVLGAVLSILSINVRDCLRPPRASAAPQAMGFSSCAKEIFPRVGLSASPMCR